MTGTAILCSGQGAQGAGMFNLLAAAPEAAAVFNAAKGALGGHDPRKLVRQASDDDLHANRAGQILCCTQAMAAWAVIGAWVPRPLVVAGYSVGELAAWGIAGVLDAGEVLDLAVTRALVMDNAITQPSGLAAIRGLSRRQLESLCSAHKCHIAIINAPDQMLVGGTWDSLKAVIDDAEAHGARSATVLPVAVPSHTPLLRRASNQFRVALEKVAVGELPSDVRLLSGIDGDAVFNMQAGREKLASQIRQTVNWAACMESCRAAGVTKILELGPGSALVRLMRAIMPDSDIHGLSEFHSLDGLKQWIGTARS
jgi:[acyl-carrier-protein] S-malonyltransferase